ncbi:hypothetical protein [Lysobacter changpingensis]|uniref:hypothetical protein n=1 Tax=Lysobacter changpingensis TaxID=2792784 RepID=UPI001A8E0CAB|nr:hypothetical protein [Lysobacter changpingensis]
MAHHPAGGIAARCFAIALGCLALSGCTSVGVQTGMRHALDYGPRMQLRVCVLHTPDVKPARVDALIRAVNDEFADYGIEVVVPWSRPWQRAGFSHERLFDDIARRELEAPCDRLVAFVDRNAGDALWGLLMPEVLGMVDEATHTRGYVVATRASLNQLFVSPAKATVHEFYHLLGCPHAESMDACYQRIAALKQARAEGADFVPGVDGEGEFVMTREMANRTLHLALAGQPGM